MSPGAWEAQWLVIYTCLSNLREETRLSIRDGQQWKITWDTPSMALFYCSQGHGFINVDQVSKSQSGTCENTAEEDCLEGQRNPNWGTPMRGWWGKNEAEKNASCKTQITHTLGSEVRSSQKETNKESVTGIARFKPPMPPSCSISQIRPPWPLSYPPSRTLTLVASNTATSKRGGGKKEENSKCSSATSPCEDREDL